MIYFLLLPQQLITFRKDELLIGTIIRIENGLAFAITFYLYAQLDFPIWMFFVFLLVPDVTMLGYAINTKIGAIVYNIGHSLIIPLLLAASYVYFTKDYLLIISLIWVAHLFMDRMLGYGLKYTDSFKKTHIQQL